MRGPRDFESRKTLAEINSSYTTRPPDGTSREARSRWPPRVTSCAGRGAQGRTAYGKRTRRALVESDDSQQGLWSSFLGPRRFSDEFLTVPMGPSSTSPPSPMVVRVVPRSGNQENLCNSLLTVHRVCGAVSGSRIVFNPVNLSIYYLDLHYLSSPYQESSLPPRARLVRPLVYPARARLLYVPCLVFPPFVSPVSQGILAPKR